MPRAIHMLSRVTLPSCTVAVKVRTKISIAAVSPRYRDFASLEASHPSPEDTGLGRVLELVDSCRVSSQLFGWSSLLPWLGACVFRSSSSVSGGNRHALLGRVRDSWRIFRARHTAVVEAGL
jgi:hypothetical protein